MVTALFGSDHTSELKFTTQQLPINAFDIEISMKRVIIKASEKASGVPSMIKAGALASALIEIKNQLERKAHADSKPMVTPLFDKEVSMILAGHGVALIRFYLYNYQERKGYTKDQSRILLDLMRLESGSYIRFIQLHLLDNPTSEELKTILGTILNDEQILSLSSDCSEYRHCELIEYLRWKLPSVPLEAILGTTRLEWLKQQTSRNLQERSQLLLQSFSNVSSDAKISVNS